MSDLDLDNIKQIECNPDNAHSIVKEGAQSILIRWQKFELNNIINLSKEIISSKKLRVLSICACELDEEGIYILASSIASSTSLEYLIFRENNLSHISFSHIINAFCKNGGIYRIFLTDNISKCNHQYMEKAKKMILAHKDLDRLNAYIHSKRKRIIFLNKKLLE